MVALPTGANAQRELSLEDELRKLDGKIEQLKLMDRLVETDSDSMVKSYKTRIKKLETDRAVLVEKSAQSPHPMRSCDAALGTTLDFISNPHKLWSSELLPPEPPQPIQKISRTYHGGVSFKKAHIMARRTAASTIPDALRNFDSLPDSANVRQPVVEALFGCSGSTVWRMVKRTDLPAPRKLSGRISTWNVGQLRKKL